MNKEKPFSYKDQEIINEYNKKRSKEITEERLNNIEKLRENFKKEVITQYKENLICSLNIFLGHYIEQLKKEEDIFYLNKLKGSIDIIQFLMAFLPLCTIFKFYHINAEKSLSTDFSPHF
ncbi:hypothetical protein [Spiroplasma ixodetis]|uniref:hypothetical protein n=1 Tax=Spiroplasma ixodetis TaxID=2141 RepID=UPI0025786044|nr:hypothetical protein [Spiroplasma ixodetis]WJG70475.1 hypothetical protein SIXOD_v1c16420 [Spiroplasma ixodetis Y32]